LTRLSAYGKLPSLCLVKHKEKEGSVNNALHSRRLLLLLALLLLTLALVACERPLNNEEQPATSPEAPVVPEETQPEAATPAPGTEETGAAATEEPAAPAGEATAPAEGGQSETAPEQTAPAPEGGEASPTEAAPAEEPTAAPAPTEAAPAAQPGVEQTYVVQAGDNLFRIGLRYGCSVLELATYNGIAYPDWISVGQVIRIPATCGG
jgi:nucleoid-associated protein YgaU